MALAAAAEAKRAFAAMMDMGKIDVAKISVGALL
jgi:predicted 3-demethylubiquinone-9 3-methyltransferase (glyoxalase superfamily)